MLRKHSIIWVLALSLVLLAGQESFAQMRRPNLRPGARVFVPNPAVNFAHTRLLPMPMAPRTVFFNGPFATTARPQVLPLANAKAIAQQRAAFVAHEEFEERHRRRHMMHLYDRAAYGPSYPTYPYYSIYSPGYGSYGYSSYGGYTPSYSSYYPQSYGSNYPQGYGSYYPQSYSPYSSSRYGSGYSSDYSSYSATKDTNPGPTPSGDKYYGATSGVGPVPAPAEKVAHIEVIVPDDGAKVWFNGYHAQGKGSTRYFNSPELTPGTTFSYTIRVAWNEAGQGQAKDRVVYVTAGSHLVVDFSQTPVTVKDIR
jgi:uncharacterized protein (TIGR03000 family)